MSVAAGMKAVWEAAKKDFRESSHTETLKQDVLDVLDIAKNKASAIKRSSNQQKVTASSKVGPRVNHDVGAELLSHFKEEWAGIHRNTEDASEVSLRLDANLSQLDQSLSKSYVITNRCREEFVMLREVIETLDEAQSKVESISELLSQVEKDIQEYSLAKAELEMERRKHSLQRQHERELLENRSRVEHLRKVLVNEQEMSLNLKHEVHSMELKERQLIFQEMFDRQMADYRTHGEVDRPIIGNEARERSQSQLEEVVIEDEDGTASLHEFLSDVVLDDLPSLDDMPSVPGDKEEVTTPEAVEATPTTPEGEDGGVKATPTQTQEAV